MRIWTEEQKQKQREAIHRWSPWKNSTGPRTSQGKARSSLNATRHGFRSRAGIELMALFTQQRAFLRAVELRIRTERLRKKLQKTKNTPNELLRHPPQKQKNPVQNPPLFRSDHRVGSFKEENREFITPTLTLPRQGGGNNTFPPCGGRLDGG